MNTIILEKWEEFNFDEELNKKWCCVRDQNCDYICVESDYNIINSEVLDKYFRNPLNLEDLDKYFRNPQEMSKRFIYSPENHEYIFSLCIKHNPYMSYKENAKELMDFVKEIELSLKVVPIPENKTYFQWVDETTGRNCSIVLINEFKNDMRAYVQYKTNEQLRPIISSDLDLDEYYSVDGIKDTPLTIVRNFDYLKEKTEKYALILNNQLIN